MKGILSFCLTVFAPLAVCIMASCSAPLKVTSDYDKHVSFQQYKTFNLIRTTDPQKQSISQLNQNRINNAATGEMVRKGFTQSDTPDLWVDLAVVLQDKKTVTANTDYYGYGGFYRPYGWGGGMGVTGYTTYSVQSYKDGSLIIDIVDAKTKSLVWEGIGNKELDGPIKDPDSVIPSAVSKTMASFPPGMVNK